MKPKAPTAQYEATHAAAPTLANHTRSSPLTALRSLDRGFLALLVLFVAFAPLVTHRIYASDEIQYFSYTHSLFFDRDLDFSNQYLYFCNVDKVKFADFCRDLYGKREPATGLPINVAPIGTGLFWLPPFAITHAGVLLARALGARVQADGFSPPYIYAITWASYAYGCAGLFLCYLLARRLFGSGLAALAVITAWLATSVIFYTVVAPPWSHATSLLTVTLFLWLWYRTRRPEGRTLKEWALLGAAAGAMMLVREQDALFMIVPAIEVAVILLVAIRIHSSRDQGSGIRDQDPPPSLTPGPRPLTLILGLATMVVIAAIVFIPQLTAYRVITGHFGPSNVVSGKFFWTYRKFVLLVLCV
ncbi:MAG: glycosyltransferase family 39 protein, partial [Chloroflexia bacterium]